MRYRQLKDAVAAALESPEARRSNGRARVLCPNCVSSKTNRPDHSMSVHLIAGWFYCQRCNVRGKLWDSVEETVRAIGGDDTAPAFEFSSAVSGGQALWAVSREHGLGKKLAQFIEYRKLPELWHAPFVTVRSSLNTDTDFSLTALMHRVDKLDEVAGAQRLYCSEQFSRWVVEKRTLAGSDRAHAFYNAHQLMRPCRRPVLVVEGLFDAVAHLPDAVAVMGTPAEGHLEALAFAPRPVVLVLDGDAWERGWANSEYLRFMGQWSASVRLPPRKDPDDFTRAQLMRAAIDELLETV